MTAGRVGPIAGIIMIVRRSLRQHYVSTTITVGAAALASGLVIAVFSIQHQARRAFTGGQAGFDAVLGARGSQLQLVLNTVYHLETSPGNIRRPAAEPYRRSLASAGWPRPALRPARRYTLPGEHSR